MAQRRRDLLRGDQHRASAAARRSPARSPAASPSSERADLRDLRPVPRRDPVRELDEVDRRHSSPIWSSSVTTKCWTFVVPPISELSLPRVESRCVIASNMPGGAALEAEADDDALLVGSVVACGFEIWLPVRNGAVPEHVVGVRDPRARACSSPARAPFPAARTRAGPRRQLLVVLREVALQEADRLRLRRRRLRARRSPSWLFESST